MMYLRTQHRAFVSPVQSRHPSRGMGTAATDAQYTQAFGGAAAPAVAAATASTAAGILGVSTAVAIPIVGAAIVGITILAAELIKNSGCGQTCIETSGWANQAEPLLRQNINAYFSVAVPRTQSQQNTALANFDAIWATLVNMCSAPSTGNAGVRCIGDRQSGACTWKATADSPWPGGPAQGACWNWFNAYRDPIANDPNVVADSAASIATSAVSKLSSLPAWALIAAAVGLVAVLS